MLVEREEIERLVRSKFRFLTDEFGFKGPRLEETSLTMCFEYLSQKVGIDVEVELFDFFVSMLVVRLADGSPPNGYCLDGGVVCRAYLAEVLRTLRLEDEGTVRDVMRLRGVGTWEEQVDRKTSLLRRNLPAVLGSADTLFGDCRGSGGSPV